MSRRIHYHVYVIELSKDVLFEGKFKNCNPGYMSGKPCVYVGMTGLDPDERFDKHKAGIQSNSSLQWARRSEALSLYFQTEEIVLATSYSSSNFTIPVIKITS